MTMNACRKVMMSVSAVGNQWILVVIDFDDRMLNLMLMVKIDSIAVSACVVILVEFDRI